jgi:sugar phosphate isomerase/epimerase
MDAANLFHIGKAKRENVQSTIAEAIGLLSPWIVLAHGKDIKEGDGLDYTCPGKGIIDFDFFTRELKKNGYKGGMLLHGIKDPNDIASSVEFMSKYTS